MHTNPVHYPHIRVIARTFCIAAECDDLPDKKQTTLTSQPAVNWGGFWAKWSVDLVVFGSSVERRIINKSRSFLALVAYSAQFGTYQKE